MLESKYLFKFLFAGIVLFCIDAFGAGLERSGTEMPLENPLKSIGEAKIRESLQKIYTAEIGVPERTGRNDGARVEQYLKYCGLSKGSPYCACFVSWCMGQASITNPRTGWSPALFPAERVVWSRSRGLQSSKYNPPPGDVFGIYFPEKKRVAHVGFVEKWGDSWVVTVEGVRP